MLGDESITCQIKYEQTAHRSILISFLCALQDLYNHPSPPQALELHGDLSNITQTYMRDPDCGFWVAEVLELAESTEYDYLMNKTKKVKSGVLVSHNSCWGVIRNPS